MAATLPHGMRGRSALSPSQRDEQEGRKRGRILGWSNAGVIAMRWPCAIPQKPSVLPPFLFFPLGGRVGCGGSGGDAGLSRGAGAAGGGGGEGEADEGEAGFVAVEREHAGVGECAHAAHEVGSGEGHAELEGREVAGPAVAVEAEEGAEEVEVNGVHVQWFSSVLIACTVCGYDFS